MFLLFEPHLPLTSVLCYSSPGKLTSSHPPSPTPTSHPHPQPSPRSSGCVLLQQRGAWKASTPARGPSKSQCVGTEHQARPTARLWGRIMDEEHQITGWPGQAEEKEAGLWNLVMKFITIFIPSCTTELAGSRVWVPQSLSSLGPGFQPGHFHSRYAVSIIITLSTKVYSVKAFIFPVVMHSCES